MVGRGAWTPRLAIPCCRQRGIDPARSRPAQNRSGKSHPAAVQPDWPGASIAAACVTPPSARMSKAQNRTSSSYLRLCGALKSDTPSTPNATGVGRRQVLLPYLAWRLDARIGQSSCSRHAIAVALQPQPLTVILHFVQPTPQSIASALKSMSACHENVLIVLRVERNDCPRNVIFACLRLRYIRFVAGGLLP
jgi:hypothetical protein